jgi:hypothetical protein
LIGSSDTATSASYETEVDHNTVTLADYGIQADGTVGQYNLRIHDNIFASIVATEIWASGGGTGLFVSGNVKAGPTALSNQPLSIAGALDDDVLT